MLRLSFLLLCATTDAARLALARSGLHVPAPRAVLSMAAPQEEMTEHEIFLKRMEQAGAGKLKPRKRDRLSAEPPRVRKRDLIFKLFRKDNKASSSAMTVAAACKFMADPSLDSLSVADKKAFLAAKGVDAFVIAQAECVAPEDNVQGHPELLSESTGMSVTAACKFMADPSLASASVADKKAFLASKGVDAFVIAQSECVAPEDNVQGGGALASWGQLRGSGPTASRGVTLKRRTLVPLLAVLSGRWHQHGAGTEHLNPPT